MSTFKQSLQKGEKELDKGRNVSAARYFTKVLRSKDPNERLTAHFYLALAKLRTGSLRDAEKHARIVIANNPVEPHANLNLGVIREKRGDSRSASSLYKKEIKLNPGSLPAYYNLGQMNCDRSKWKAALPYLLRCYRHGYQAEHLEEDVARAARKSRNLRIEREVYKKELRKHPKDIWSLNNLAATYIDTGNLKRARPLLLAALRSLDSGHFQGRRTDWHRLIKRNLTKAAQGQGRKRSE
jgi:Flp pilus assembly protein TadD